VIELDTLNHRLNASAPGDPRLKEASVIYQKIGVLPRRSLSRLKTMLTCVKCGSAVRGRRCRVCGSPSPAEAVKLAYRTLTTCSYLALAGLVGLLAGAHYYPPLDSERLMMIGVCIFFLPILLHIVSAVRKRLALDVGCLRAVYLTAGCALVLIALGTTANGALDRGEAQTIHPVVIRRSTIRGRYSVTRVAHVKSWRPGRESERLEVNSQTFAHISAGKEMTVTVHPGLLSMPWYDHGSPAE
jgi:hypothetical protein